MGGSCPLCGRVRHLEMMPVMSNGVMWDISKSF